MVQKNRKDRPVRTRDSVVEFKDFDVPNTYSCIPEEEHKSSVAGVSRSKQRWTVWLSINGKRTYCGIFINKIDAERTALKIRELNPVRFRRPKGYINRNVQTGGTSKYRGVCWKSARSKWSAAIHPQGKSKHLGYFIDDKDAARAYDTKAREVFGEFASLNFPGD